MLTFDHYERPATADEAYALLQKRGTIVLGGGGWLRLGTRHVPRVVDPSDIVSDAITETADTFEIGAMSTLRAFEQHPALNAFFTNAPRDCVRDIVGVQFRNIATVGGSVWGRFGFSDVLTLLQALDASVTLHHGGKVPIAAFAERSIRERDLLLSVTIPKKYVRAAIFAERQTANDLPMLTVAAALDAEGFAHISVGARPARATAPLVLPVSEETPRLVAEQTAFGSNHHASAAYRRILCQALVRRCLRALREEDASC